MDFCNNTDSIDILLVGKSGQGKSATGNSILQQKIFQISNNTKVEISGAKRGTSTFDQREITVVDTPGLSDVRLHNKHDITSVVKIMSESMTINLEGYHAIVLVVKFGSRFTTEDVNIVQVLKKIFGSEFLQKHGILLFTGGDNFEAEDEVLEGNLTFETWLSKQTEPHIKAVMEECGSRIILFNNKCKDEIERKNQVERLFEIVDNLTTDGTRYTNEVFSKAKQERDRLMETLGKPYLKKEQLQKISDLATKLGNINIESKNMDHTLAELFWLQDEAKSILSVVKQEDKDTNALAVAIDVVERLQTCIEEHFQNFNLLRNNAERERKFQEELQEAMSKQKRKIEQAEINTMKEEEDTGRYVDELGEMRQKQYKINNNVAGECKKETSFPIKSPSMTQQKEEEYPIESLEQLHKIKLNYPKKSESESSFPIKTQTTTEQDEEEQHSIIRAKEDYHKQMEELLRLEEEKNKIIEQAAKQKKIVDEAKVCCQMILTDEIKKHFFEQIQTFIESYISKVNFDA